MMNSKDINQVKRYVGISNFLMVVVGLATLFFTGLTKSVPIHFNFRFEADSFAPAIVMITIFPLLNYIVYIVVKNKSPNLEPVGIFIYKVCILLAIISHIFLCLFAIYY